MPTYCYKCLACGHKQEVVKLLAKVKRLELCPIDSFAMVRDYQAERGFHNPGNWPMESNAAGVAASQAVEAMQEATKMGIPTEFNKETGDAIFTSRKHRKDYCRAIGLHDRNGGYSDP